MRNLRSVARVIPGALLLFPAFAADLPTGESLLERCLISSGGAAAHAKVTGATMTGTVEMVGQNIKGPLSVFQQGDKTYTVIELPGIGKVEEGFDGQIAWETNSIQGARIKDHAEKEASVRASRLNLMSDWRQFYKEARTQGSEDVDGKPAWKVELLPIDGKPEFFYFDKDSAMLVRMTQVVPTALGEIPVDVTLSDYRSVGGVLTPFTMTQKAMTQIMVLHFDKVEWNPSLPPNRFDLPEAIKALAAKRKP
jgi:hypothetical protein